jgi:hypothetical protein
MELRNKRGLAKNEVTMCIGSVSKVDVITIATLSLPSGLVMNLNNCYLVLALSMNIISDSVYCKTVIQFQRIIVILFIWIISLMIMHLK